MSSWCQRAGSRGLPRPCAGRRGETWRATPWMRVLPQTEHLAKQMLMNARSWQKQWENEGKTPPSDADKKALAERISKMEGKFRSCQLGKTAM
mmetsp:Transcript_44150/g.103104  ORF Transcript_44150/g.103104 Transcript_44150/m.103104 type:complete len:93 (+) Transcript_44150:102-380(+)